jgi:hypothetical protein
MPSKVLTADEIERLTEIKDEIGNLANEARRIIRDTSEEEAARRYWLAAIEIALGDDHSFLGRNMRTMQESVDALDEEYLNGERIEAVE